MSEFKFFMEREDRWVDNMKTLWGSLSICPLVTCIRLPHHMAEELDSISHLKIWGNAQSPHQDMAYLLVWVDNTPNATQAEASLPRGMGELVLPLDTSSQTSVEGMEASVESNPVEATLVAAAHSGWSDSPVQDLQLEVHLAINSIFTAKRTSKLERQSAIRNFETSLHQHEAEAVAANEEAKVACSQRDLQTRIKCAKVIMKVKLDYWVTVQEARVV